MIPKGIFFDLDDTIVSFSAVARPLWKSLCSEHSENQRHYDSEALYNAILEVSKGYWSDRIRHRNGRLNLKETRRKIVRGACLKLGIDSVEIAVRIADTFSVLREERVTLFPSSIETLEHFHTAGTTLALITNGESETQRSKIRRFGLEKYFSTILVEGEAGYGKPDREIYLDALGRTGLNPEEVWMVGDNLEWDIQGAHAVGIHAIWNDHRKQGLPEGAPVVPDRIIHSIAELVLKK